MRRVVGLLERHRIVGILGARQVGKTTLARAIAEQWPGATIRFDLEDPDDLARLAEPKLALAGLHGLVVLDEIQRLPGLFPVLRVLVDRPESRTRFLILGSASPSLIRRSSETLAGRIAYYQLDGFTLDEVGGDHWQRLWLRGGFPRSFLAPSDAASAEWRREFARTFLERDVPQLGSRIPAHTLGRFWSMLAHYHAQVWNGAELARAFGVAESTVRRYLDLLAGALVIRQLQPWHENIKKRQVRSPKVYVVDSGLVHTLLRIGTMDDLQGHPKVGASWEGFAMSQVLGRLEARADEVFFWATHAGAELDLLVVRGRQRLGFEFKRTSAPRVTRSMRSACETLRLDRLDVIHAGSATFPLSHGIRAVACSRVLEDIAPLGS